jgi:hypothetical protein
MSPGSNDRSIEQRHECHVTFCLSLHRWYVSAVNVETKRTVKEQQGQIPDGAKLTTDRPGSQGENLGAGTAACSLSSASTQPQRLIAVAGKVLLRLWTTSRLLVASPLSSPCQDSGDTAAAVKMGGDRSWAAHRET